MIKRKRLISSLLIVGLAVTTIFSGNFKGIAAIASTNNNEILLRTQEWKYSDEGKDLGKSWSATDYDDSKWKLGKAPLGFGDDVSETDPNVKIGTVISYGNDENNKHMTSYFRTTIDVKDLNKYKELEVYIHVDDGAVIYVNGKEAVRKGIPDGEVNYNTPGKFKQKEETFKVPTSFLVEGKNVIAAEVHQDSKDSSDLWFEMGIKGLDGSSPVEPPKEEPFDPTAPKGEVSKVVATMYGDSTSEKAFTWYTTRASVKSNLQVVEKSVGDFNKGLKFNGTAALSTNSKNEIVHKANAKGLKPGTTYIYRVGDEALNLWSNVGEFKTGLKDGKFTFINLADSQAKTEEEAKLSGETFRKALNTVPNAEFISINGDIVDTGVKEEQWNWMLGNAQDVLMKTTLVPVAGNHDAGKNAFIDHFNLKTPEGSDISNGAYYSYDYGNVHFVILNNNEDSPEYEDFSVAQVEWMKKDIQDSKKNGAKWVIVKMHKGPYTTSNHATDSDIMGPNGVREKIAPLMEELGVDLVLQGHDHIYSRTKPLYNGKAIDAEKIKEDNVDLFKSPQGTIYLNPNTAGAKVYYKNKDIDPSYYDLFDRAEEHHGAVYGPEDPANSRPKRGQVQNFMSFSIDGDELIATTYEIDQNKNNKEPFVVDTFGITKAKETSVVNPTNPSNPSNPGDSNPKTGDEFPIYLGILLIIGSGAVITGVIREKSKKVS
ncbi:MAG: metallophosphoesterase [Clostridium sp.]